MKLYITAWYDRLLNVTLSRPTPKISWSRSGPVWIKILPNKTAGPVI